MAEMNWEVLDEESRRRLIRMGFRGKKMGEPAKPQAQTPVDERYVVANTPDYSSDKARRERIKGE